MKMATTLSRLLIGTTLVVGLGTVLPAQSRTATLTNADVVRMVKAQLSPGVIAATVDASDLNFDLSPDGLIALKQAGVPDQLIQLMQAKMRDRNAGAGPASSPRAAPEKSNLLTTSKEPAFILRNFKTMLVIAARAKYFGTDDMKAALGRDSDFKQLAVSIVDDPSVADTVLDVDYTFAWDYPFTLKHQNTSSVLLSGKGYGPFSGPLGAASVAGELAKLLKPHRTQPDPKTRNK
jgi:hypothetical protein